jgi:hypothetical protein
MHGTSSSLSAYLSIYVSICLPSGHLKVFQCDDRLRVVLYRYLDPSSLSSGPDNLAPFAECPIQVRPGDPITPFVDGVIDSSRYFVLR